MDGDKSREQIPIFRFLNKHKWRLVLPLLLYLGYFYLPIHQIDNRMGVVSRLSVTSTRNAAPEDLKQEVAKVADAIQSDESILRLIKKAGFLAEERRSGMSEGELIDKMRVSMVVGTQDDSPAGNVGVFVWANLPGDGPEKTTALSDEIINSFASHSDFSVTYAPPPPRRDSGIGLPTRMLFRFLAILPALLCSIFLIFVSEIPNLFYSTNTQEMVFDPIRSDWKQERVDAKTHGTVISRVAVDIRYSFGFMGAMLAKSPIGEVVEFVGKFARVR